jgi:hypothetical protein
VGVITSAGQALRVTAFLTVLGFLTVILIGPVLVLIAGILALFVTLAAFILPFALVGVLVWGIYVLAAEDRKTAWLGLRRQVASLGRWFVGVPVAASVRICKWGAGVVRALTPIAVPVARRAAEAAREGVQKGVVLAERGAEAAGNLAEKARPAAHFAGGVVLEMIGGAAVGTILVCLADSQPRGGVLGLHLLAGAVGGMFLGLLVGVVRSSPKPERG